MDDKSAEILKQALGDEQVSLTEDQRATAKKAAIFAVTTFSTSTRIGQGILTEEQFDFAKNLQEVFPKPREVLPKSEFESAYSGYSGLVSTPMFELIPGLVKNENATFGGFHHFEVAPEKFREDPTGVSYIRYLLQEAEENSTISQMDLKGKEDEVKSKIAAILYASRDIPDEPPQPKPLDDRDVTDDIISALMSAFGANRNQRDNFINKARNALHNEIPMEIGEDGKILPSAALHVLGARLAFEQYQAAVKIFMNRWGDKS